MKRIIAAIMGLLLTSVWPLPAFTGTLTANEFLYKPSLGARGDTEKNTFDAGLDRLDARLGKEIWVGDPNYGPTLRDAITAIGSTPAILRVPTGAHNIGADLTIPATLTLKPERGALLAITSGATLTFNHFVDPGPYQIFSDANTDNTKGVKFAKGCGLQFVRPEWWGAVSDGSTSAATGNKLAIQKAIDASGNWSVPVQLPAGQCYVDGTIYYRSGTKLYGVGSPDSLYTTTNGSSIRLKQNANVNLLSSAGASLYDVELKDITFICDSQTSTSVNAFYAEDGVDMRFFEIRNCKFISFPNWAIYWGQVGQAKIKDCFIAGGNGIRFNGFNSWLTGNEIIVGNGAHVGVRLCGGTSHILNNIIYGNAGQGGGRIGMQAGGADTCEILNNWLSDLEIGLDAGDYAGAGPLVRCRVRDNLIYGCTTKGFNLLNSSANLIEGNTFKQNPGLAIYATYADDTLVEKNTFFSNSGGNIVQEQAETLVIPSTYMLCQNNFGIDLPYGSPAKTAAADFASLATGDFPAVYTGKRFKTANVGSTGITGLLGGSNGKEITLTIAESNSTLQKWGEATYIYTYDTSANTWSANNASNPTAPYFPSSPADNDALYIGLGNIRFCGLKLNIGTQFAAAAVTFNWEYWNGSTWAALTGVSNPNVLKTGSGEQTIYWNPVPNSAWWCRSTLYYTDLHSDPGTQPSFWIRIRLSGVTDATNPGANQSASIKRSSLRLAADTFPATPLTAGQVGMINLICRDHIWWEMSRSLSGN